MKNRSQIAALLLGLAVAVGPLWGQQGNIHREGNAWVEEITGTIPAAKSVRVTAAMGSVRIQGSDRSDIAYTVRKRSYASSEEAARREFERFRVTANRSGDTAVITGESDEHNFRRFSAEFRVDTPRNLDFAKVDTRGGSVSVQSITGRADVTSGGGSLSLQDIGGPVVARSGGGSIEVGGIGGDMVLKTGGGSIQVSSAKGRVDANTGGGSIEIGSATQAVTAHTGGGSIEVHDCGGDLELTTGGGSIETGHIGGPARVSTGGGSVRLSGAKGPVDVSTGGGTIELYSLTQGARVSTGAGSIIAEFIGNGSGSSLSTSAGDVTVYLASGFKGTVNASIEMASGHRIRSDFPELKITSEGPEYGPRTIYAEGSLNGGGPLLKIRTTTGDIEILRAKK